MQVGQIGRLHCPQIDPSSGSESGMQQLTGS
jgi:hypothetical protein